MYRICCTRQGFESPYLHKTRSTKKTKIMETIVTIGLSVMSTLMVVFFIWAVMGIRKVQGDISDMNLLLREFESDMENVYDSLDDISDSNSSDIQNCRDKSDKAEDHLHNEIRKYNEDSFTYTESKIREIYSDLDRRFDKIYTKLYQECPNMKPEKDTQINS